MLWLKIVFEKFVITYLHLTQIEQTPISLLIPTQQSVKPQPL